MYGPGRSQPALIERHVINQQVRHDASAVEREDAALVRRSRVPPPSKRQMGIEAPAFERDAGALDASRRAPLDISELARPRTDTHPEHTRRAMRRKDAESLEGQRKRRHVDEGRNRVHHWRQSL